MFTTQTLLPQQIDIVNFTTNNDKNLLLKAGPGSGKSFMLTQIVYNNIGKRILIVVFNTSIKEELQKKVGKLANVITFHQLGNALVKKHAVNNNIKFKWNTALHDSKKGGNPENKYKFIIRKLLKENDEHYSLLDEVKTIANYIRLTNTDLNNIPAIVEMIKFYDIPITSINSIQLAVQAIHVGIDQYKSGQWTDYADMLYLPIKMNMKPEIGMALGAKDDNMILPELDMILIDEAQDQNALMAELTCKFLFHKTKVIAVGDVNQSINGFAGSLPDSLDRLAKTFSMESLPLTMTFRCPSTHTDYVNNLFGTNLTAFKEGGTIQNIPFAGITTMLKPNDFVIGRKQNSKDAKLFPLFHDLLRQGKACTLLGIDALQLSTKHLDECNTDEWNNVTNDFMDYSNDQRTFYQEKGWKNKLEEFNNEAYLVNVLLEYAEVNNIRSYESFQKAVKAFNYDKKDSIRISTTHKAKGLEADNIYLLDAGLFPYVKESQHDWQKTQERNLHYVALTRSKDKLFLVN